MLKSQLRRLALDYAQGHVDHDSYVRERTELIDAIVSGRVDIRREAATPPPTVPRQAEVADAAAVQEPPLPEEPASRRLSPLHIAVGGVVIAALAAVLLSGGEQPATAPRMVLTRQPPPPAPPEPADARALVDAFLGENDWSTAGLDGFARRWEGLPEPARAEARSAPWFRPLSTAVKQEINAQRALAGLDGGGPARREGQRLVVFAKRIGVAGPFPSFDPAPHGAVAGASQSEAVAVPTLAADDAVAGASQSEALTAPAAAADDAVAGASQSGAVAAPAAVAAAPVERVETAVATAPVEVAVTAAAPAPRPAAEPAAPPPSAGALPLPAVGSAWLERLPADAVTVQLFAVNQLDAVERLLSAHPQVELHVLAAAAGEQPRYRVVHGPFPDRATASAAHAALPASLRDAQGTALLRTAAELRESVASASTPAYTLQLFASPQRDNVQKLLDDYPQLALRIHADTEGSGAFRVLYGEFSSVDAARAGARALPDSLLEAVGPPLIKDANAPDGATISAVRP